MGTTRVPVACRWVGGARHDTRVVMTRMLQLHESVYGQGETQDLNTSSKGTCNKFIFTLTELR